MTELLYLKDSYLKDFDATLLAIDEEQNVIILNRTAFFPGGGGQPSDNGFLIVEGKRLNIQKIIKNSGNILHITEDDVRNLNIGERIAGHINWDRRYQIMRTHTAMHILCGVIFRDYRSSVTGGNMEPLIGRMDFEFETLNRELVKKIEKAVNQEVQKKLPVRTNILPREDAFQIPDLIRTKINLLPEAIREIRTVEIVGLDLQADGGTHVKNTIEVGEIRLIDYKSKGKINKRIYLEINADQLL